MQGIHRLLALKPICNQRLQLTFYKNLFAMVRVARVHRPSAVQLLNEQHTHHGVRQSQVGQADALMRRLFELWLQPIGATDHQSQIVALQLPVLEALRQILRAQRSAALIEHHDAASFGDGRFNALALGRVERGQRLGAARLGLDRFEPHLEFRWKALGIVVVGRLRPVGHMLPDGDNEQPHAFLVAAARTAPGFFAAPRAVVGLMTTVGTWASAWGAAVLRAGVLRAVAVLLPVAAVFLAAVLRAVVPAAALAFSAGAFLAAAPAARFTPGFLAATVAGAAVSALASSEAVRLDTLVLPSLTRTAFSPQISSR